MNQHLLQKEVLALVQTGKHFYSEDLHSKDYSIALSQFTETDKLYVYIQKYYKILRPAFEYYQGQRYPAKIQTKLVKYVGKLNAFKKRFEENEPNGCIYYQDNRKDLEVSLYRFLQALEVLQVIDWRVITDVDYSELFLGYWDKLLEKEQLKVLKDWLRSAWEIYMIYTEMLQSEHPIFMTVYQLSHNIVLSSYNVRDVIFEDNMYKSTLISKNGLNELKMDIKEIAEKHDVVENIFGGLDTTLKGNYAGFQKVIYSVSELGESYFYLILDLIDYLLESQGSLFDKKSRSSVTAYLKNQVDNV